MTLEATLSALAASREVSGETLAAQLGLSRAALWKRIEQLRALGVDVEATAGKGYRLAQPIDLLDADELRDRVEHDAPGLMRSLSVEWSIDSTNLAVAQFGEDLHGRVVLAEHQAGGRGRRGRAWQSPLAANLYLSIGWRFACGAAGLAGLSVAIGVAAVESLRAQGFDDVALKWPNDLVANGTKLGGLLIEIGGEIGGPSNAVIGLGVNARMPRSAASGIDQPWTDLEHLGPQDRETGRSPTKEWTRTTVAASLIAKLLETCAEFDRRGFAAFRERYPDVDALKNTDIDIHLNDRRIAATANGIDDQGLLVAIVDGEPRRFASGEVSVRRRA